MDVYFFTSPCHGVKYDTAILAKYLPGYRDFSVSLSDEQYFGDPRHMNAEGAEAFTRLLGETYFGRRNAAAIQPWSTSQNRPSMAARE